jgi:diguanylate cyclase (GGDEF)-like protein
VGTTKVPGDPTDVAGGELDVEPEIMRALLSAYQQLDLGGQLGALLTSVQAWSGASCGFGLAASDDPGKLILAAATVPEKDKRYHVMARLDRHAVKEISLSGPHVFIGFGPLEPQLTRWPAAAPAFSLIVPLLVGSGEWVGALLLPLDQEPSAACLDRLRQLLALVPRALENVLQVAGLRDLVIKDDTAHCFNRRHLEDFLPEELERSIRYDTPMSLIFLDMDNLKAVNNEHGHSMGSSTLREVSYRIRAKIRKFDKLFRFGGDEFCIILPNTEWQGALEVAERVRDSISKVSFLTSFLGSPGVNMSASLGVASYPLHARNRADMIEKADRAMQDVKDQGKNGVGVAKELGDGDE